MSEPRGPRPKRASQIRAIYRKELLETLRDRRTLATMILIPMVSYPLFLLGASEAYQVNQRRDQAERSHVTLLGESAPAIQRALRNDAQIWAWSVTSSASAAEQKVYAAELLRRAETDLVLTSSSTSTYALDHDGTAETRLYYDQTRPRAELALSRTRTVLARTAAELRRARLARAGLPESAATPIRVETESISTAKQVGNQLASLYLPLLILFFVALTAFHPAVDMTAGEKERGTLGTLLTMPIHAYEIVLGKYGAVVTVATLAGLLNVAVIAGTMLRAISENQDAPHPVLGVGLALGLFCAAVLLAILVSALMLVTASLARSFRDASNLLAPVMLLVQAPAIFTFMPSVELTPGWAVVPVAGLVLLMKSLLGPGVPFLLGAVVALATLVQASLLLALAVRIFKDEHALFGYAGPRLQVGRVFLAPPEPNVPAGLVFAAMLFIGQFYGSLLLGGRHPLVAVAMLQISVFALPTLLLASWVKRREPIAPLFRLSWPAAPGLAFGAALLMGLSAWLGLSLPILWFQDWLFGDLSEFAAFLKSMLGLGGVPLGVLWIALAVLPAVCEELAFRGALLGFFRRQLGPVFAVILQALIFGLVHGSMFRLIPTGALGILLGVLALRTGSIWPGVLVHALSNGILLTIDQVSPAAATLELSTPTAWAGVGLLGLLASFLLLFVRLTGRTPAS